MLTSWAVPFPPSAAQAKRRAFTTQQPCAHCLGATKNGGRHASDTDHADDGDDDAELPGIRRGRCPATRSRRGIVDRSLLRGAGRGARAHRALMRLWPGLRRAGRGARRVLRLHQDGALAAAARGTETGGAGCGGATATAAAAA